VQLEDLFNLSEFDSMAPQLHLSIVLPPNKLEVACRELTNEVASTISAHCTKRMTLIQLDKLCCGSLGLTKVPSCKVLPSQKKLSAHTGWDGVKIVVNDVTPVVGSRMSNGNVFATIVVGNNELRDEDSGFAGTIPVDHRDIGPELHDGSHRLQVRWITGRTDKA
jgi:hypothetical protein